MSALSNSDRRESCDEDEPDVLPVEEASGWNAPIEFDRYLKNKDADGSFKARLIRRANHLVRLSSIIHKYGISWEVKESFGGWTHTARCPFPDHSDGSPSFGLNTKDDRFHCFGCQRSGGSVQFLSSLHNRPALDVAKDLIGKHTPSSEETLLEIEDASFTKIDHILLQFNRNVRQFLREHRQPEAIKYVKKITWNLDLYLERNGSIGALQVEPLEARIEKLNLRLKMFNE